MEDLINKYLEQCSQVCNNGGYNLLESLRLTLLRGFNEESSDSSYRIIETADRVLFEHLKGLMSSGVRIFSWDDCKEKDLREKLVGCF